MIVGRMRVFCFDLDVGPDRFENDVEFARHAEPRRSVAASS